MDLQGKGEYNRVMRRHAVIAFALRALLCLALILPGAGGLSAAPAAAGDGWLVICGANGTYSVPAPGAPAEPDAPRHADCALCAAGCAVCGPAFLHQEAASYAPRSDGAGTRAGLGEDIERPTRGVIASHPRGPPRRLLA